MAGSTAGYAVVARTTWHAQQAARALDVDWHTPPSGTVDSAAIVRQLASTAQAAHQAGEGFAFEDRTSRLRPPLETGFVPGTVTELHAQGEAFVRTLAERLTQAGARGVAVDILLAEPDRADPAGDEVLARAIAKNGRVVLPVIMEI